MTTGPARLTALHEEVVPFERFRDRVQAIRPARFSQQDRGIRTMQQQGQQQTGTRNETYNVIAILYHALQGAENCQTYLQDAKDGQIRDFVQQALQTQRQLADQGKQVLQQCLQQDTGGQSAFGWGQSSGQSGSQSGSFGDAASQNQQNFADQSSGGSSGGSSY
jgi:hypothetical protein